jgi:hypothetical protein
MPTTTAVFKFIPGDEIYHVPAQDSLLQTISVFSTNGVSDSNKISDTIDIETSLRTIVRSWSDAAVAAEFVTALQAEHTTTDELAPWPGRLVSVQVDAE